LKNGKRTLQRIEPALYRHTLNGKAVGSYFCLYSFGGRRIKESLGTEVIAEARRLLKVRRAEDERLDPGLRAATLADYCDKYYATRQGKSASTLEADLRHIERIKKEFPAGGGRALRSIRASEVLGFVGGLKKQSNPKEKLGASDRNHLAWTIRKIFRLAVADGVIAINPAEHIRAEKAPDSLKLTPTWEQFKAIVDAVRRQPQSDTREESADLLEFLGRAGLGLAEAQNLQWQDIDFERMKIQLLRQKTKKSFVVDIYPQLYPLLIKLKEGRPNLEPTSPVFRVQNAKKALAHACKSLGFAAYSPRSFRRMFITKCLERGIDPGLVAKTQGHRDGGGLILKTYRHIRPAYEAKMFELLADD